jgi:hypothetical protein
MKPLVGLAAAALLLASGMPVRGQGTGSISGMIVSRQDQTVRMGRGAVFLADGKTGRPLIGKTLSPLGTEGQAINGLSGLAHAVSDGRGYFEFPEVPPGTYRLVGQSWLGFSGVPEGKDPSEVVYLLGVADDVEVKAGERTQVFLRPLGSARMTLINDPEEAHAFLVLSRGKMRGDPVLAFPAWGEEFAKKAIGVTLMEVPRVTFHGLPDGELHAGLFNYDNSPGVGGTSFPVTDGGTARIPIYAYWSNGRDDPPETLLSLVEHLEKTKPSIKEIVRPVLKHAGESEAEFRMAAYEQGDATVRVEGFGEVRILDLLAADAYRWLREHHRAQRERALQNQSR